MITLERLYEQTREGLDIVLLYYPQAAECVNQPKSKFKARPEEKTASATLIPPRAGDQRPCWKVCDFGDDGHAISPIDICIKHEGLLFSEAVIKLAQRFNVTDQLDRSINKPEFKERPATPEEKDGTRVYKLLKEIPEQHLKILGPKVTQKHAEELNWYEAEYVGYVRDRKVKLKYSTEHYPIFMRECVVPPAKGEKSGATFFKIYEPLNPDKGFRFSYTPEGVKPKMYINGMEELKRRYREYNEIEEQKFYSEPANEDKPYVEKKYPEAVICSGERDALCCKSMGYAPLWFNSETYRLSEEEYNEIKKYAEVIYNIPDLDPTGRRKGIELALRFIDIHTIWLPEWLGNYRDNRGKPRKDLRDWMELRNEYRDFKGLIELAVPAKFWTERWNAKLQKMEYGIDTVCLHNFLQLNGFCTLKDDHAPLPRYIHIKGNVVKEIKVRDMRKFINDWVEEQCLPRDLRNLTLTSTKITAPGALEGLKEVDLEFTTYTPTSQFFYLPGQTIEVTKNGLTNHGISNDAGRYVWEDNVLPHRFTPLDDMFTITRGVDAEGKPTFDIEVRNIESKVFAFAINSSRIYWRKELEERFADRTEEEAKAYHKANPFRIDGEGLTDDEIREQKLNLINKIFSIGYMLHRYKSPSRAWALFAMDSKIGENGQCNGRSGKSFLFKALTKFLSTVTLSGRNEKLLDNNHVFEQITKETEFVFVDDCSKYLKMGVFYDLITSDMTINKKNVSAMTIPFEEAPKFGFTTNYVPTDFDASTTARMLYMVFSDYYHEKTPENDYLESRSIRDDFHCDLLTNTYPAFDWNADINFFLQCTRFYLSLVEEPIKVLPPIDNIILRKHKATMGDNFEDWASIYFSEENTEHLDNLLVRRKVYEDFINDTGVNSKSVSMRNFNVKLKAFCDFAPHIATFNPPALCNSQKRISRRVDGKLEDMIYIRTTAQERINASFTAEVERGEDMTDPATFIPDETPW